MKSNSGRSFEKGEAETMSDDREALARFVVEHGDLERLEAQLAEFNLFEAIRALVQPPARMVLRSSVVRAFPPMPH